MTGDEKISLKVYFESLMRSYCEAHDKQHLLLKENVDLAQKVLDGRLEVLNHYRARNQEELSTYLKKNEYTAQHAALETVVYKRIENYEKKVDALSVSIANLMGKIAAIGVIIVIVELLLKYVIK